MAKRTVGKLYTSGQKNYWYIRYQFDGKDCRARLLDTAGRPITDRREAEAAADRMMAHFHETDRAEQLRTLKNNIRDAETAAVEAAAMMLNSRATIADGWGLFMTCPKRPASCKRYRAEDIQPHTTASNYRSYYQRFTAWAKENAPDARLLSDITAETAAAFMEEVQRTGAAGTFNKYLQFFNCFFDTLAAAGKITADNPFRDIDRMAPEFNSKQPLTVEQIARLIDAAEGELRLLIALGYFTGLRLGDCCTLQWREVDLLRGIIERIPRKTAHTVKDKSLAVVKVGIAPYLFEMLAGTPEIERRGYVLPAFAEKYLSGGDQQITKKVLKHFAACGIETHRPGTGIQVVTDKRGRRIRTGCRAVVEIGFHSLRYSYISHNAEAGTPAAIIQRNAGHSNPAMTEHYTKISDAAAVRYAGALRLPSGNPEPVVDAVAVERAELHRLADTLSLEQIRNILANIREA
ncbi:MAG: site-specific integrase [Lentisphaeria bacterium]|nr:site-specific integrase [Lentisphaeria bacterium]